MNRLAVRVAQTGVMSMAPAQGDGLTTHRNCTDAGLVPTAHSLVAMDAILDPKACRGAS
jgi:hypothetical protein